MTTPTREIVYDAETRDFALYLDGELVGFARSYADGERVIDTILAERGKRGRLAAAATRVTISAEPRKRRVQIVRFAGLTATRSRVYYGVTQASFARLARLTGGAPHAELAA